jgi:hypothetical protein
MVPGVEQYLTVLRVDVSAGLRVFESFLLIFLCWFESSTERGDYDCKVGTISLS